MRIWYARSTKLGFSSVSFQELLIFSANPCRDMSMPNAQAMALMVRYYFAGPLIAFELHYESLAYVEFDMT